MRGKYSFCILSLTEKIGRLFVHLTAVQQKDTLYVSIYYFDPTITFTYGRCPFVQAREPNDLYLQQPWNPAALQPYNPATLQPCNPAALQPIPETNPCSQTLANPWPNPVQIQAKPCSQTLQPSAALRPINDSNTISKAIITTGIQVFFQVHHSC